MDWITHPEFDWLAQGLLLSLALGLLLSVIVSLLMLTRPERLFALNKNWSRWIDTAGLFRTLDRPHTLERFFYRHHRLLGALIALGAGFVLWEWTFAYHRAGLFGMLGARWSRPELNWIIAAGEWIVVGLHALILVIGLVILLRPSLLKNLESEGNRWHTPAVGEILDTRYSVLEQRMVLHPRVAGLLLLLASTWCLSGLLPVLRRALGG